MVTHVNSAGISLITSPSKGAGRSELLSSMRASPIFHPLPNVILMDRI